MSYAHMKSAPRRYAPTCPNANGTNPLPRVPVLCSCGNSLGVLPKKTQVYINEEMEKWKTNGVEGHFNGARPWAKIDEFVTGMTAEIVGAKDDSEVAVMNTLSVNLHLMMTSFYQPTATRYQRINTILTVTNNVRSSHRASSPMNIPQPYLWP